MRDEPHLIFASDELRDRAFAVLTEHGYQRMRGGFLVKEGDLVNTEISKRPCALRIQIFSPTTLHPSFDYRTAAPEVNVVWRILDSAGVPVEGVQLRFNRWLIWLGLGLAVAALCYAVFIWLMRTYITG